MTSKEFSSIVQRYKHLRIRPVKAKKGMVAIVTWPEGIKTICKSLVDFYFYSFKMNRI